MKHDPPGPKGNFFLDSMSEDMFTFFERCLREHGDIVKFPALHVPCYFIHHPEHIEQVLVKQSTKVRKPWDFRQLRVILGKGLLTNDGASWLKQRRIAQPAFHRKCIHGYGEIMMECIVEAVAKYKDHEAFDIYNEITDMTLKIAGETLFDVRIDNMKIVSDLLEVSMDQFAKLISRIPIPLWFPTPKNIKMFLLLRKLNRFIYTTIKEKREKGEQGKDLLSMLLAVRYEDGSAMSDTQLRDEIFTILVAGYDTTTLAISWTLYLLGKNPHIKDILVKEIDAVVGSRLPNADDLDKLIYANKVVKESLRLYPPVWGLGRETLEPIEIGEYTIPKKAQIFMLPYLLHRDPRFFEKPTEFIPERWTPEFEKNLHKYAYYPFGAGPRLCIGNYFAILEVVLFIAHLLQKKDFKLVENHPVVTFPAITLRPKHGIKIILQPRV